MRIAWLTFGFFGLLGSAAVSAATIATELRPETIDQGGVARLQVQLPALSMATVRYREQVLPLHISKGGEEAVALLGADLETEPGRYPLDLVAVDAAGQSHFHRLILHVRASRYPEERLTLPPGMVSPRAPAVVARIAAEQDLLQSLFRGRDQERLWSRFRAPVSDPVGSTFGRRRILNGQPRAPHGGVDFRSPQGTPVRAAAAGEVALVADLFFTGRTVVLNHGGGLYSVYAHLEATRCEASQRVAGGQVVGSVGSSGRATGPHLHWGVRLRGDRIDPMALVDLTSGKSID